jgi:superfamily II DNA helicase RecQ
MVQVIEFSKYGIPSIAINSFTPEDRDLWQASDGEYFPHSIFTRTQTIKNHTKYRHYALSPEQCGTFKGHLTRFARLIHDPKWTKRIRLLQLDEAHFISTTGQAKGKEEAFRPAYSDLGERQYATV